MLAVLGAEFGHEVLPKKRGVDEGKKGKKGLEGFTLSNYSLAHHTSKLYVQMLGSYCFYLCVCMSVCEYVCVVDCLFF